MKAIIFSTSIKQGKNSNTRAWCDALNNTFIKEGIKSEVINLRDYDYEASTGEDLLHKQMHKLYDANFIMFASPANFSNMSFYLTNLLERFKHANDKSSEKGLDIFANKRFEFLPSFGACTNQDWIDPKSDWEEYEGTKFPGGHASYTYLGYRHNLWVYKSLSFMKPLGMVNFRLNVWNPLAPFGPDRHNMDNHPQTLATIDRLMKKIKSSGIDQLNDQPECTINDFVECFRSDDTEHAFGRGLTLSVENLNYTNAKKHIEYINNNKCLASHVRYQAIVAMKDRSVKAGIYECAELYYNEQARHNIDWYEDSYTKTLNKNGNMRPNDY